jgi:hypothetical protein
LGVVAVPDRICSITIPEQCPNKVLARGWCSKHYSRWRTHGDPLFTLINRDIKECVICGGELHGRGWCQLHYLRWKHHGDALWEPPVIGYVGMHDRVFNARGRASDYPCFHCAVQAQQWAYNHEDPAELIDPERRLAYSLDVFNYLPLCLSCHLIFDGKRTA